MIAAIVSVVAAFIYTGSLSIQQVGNIRSMERPESNALVRLLKTPIWYVGFIIALVGFGMHWYALGIGSLVVVQAVQVTQIVWMLPFSAWTSKMGIEGREYLGAGIVLIGLAAFVSLTITHGGRDVVPDSEWIWALVITAAFAIVAAILAVVLGPVRAAMWGVVAGTCYGVQGALMKQAAGVAGDGGAVAMLTNWSLYLSLAIGICAVVFQQFALRSGKLSAGLTTITVFTPAVSVVYGLTIFQEQLPETFPGQGPLIIISALVVVAGTVMLARSPAIMAAEKAKEEGGEEPGATAATAGGGAGVMPGKAAFHAAAAARGSDGSSAGADGEASGDGAGDKAEAGTDPPGVADPG